MADDPLSRAVDELPVPARACGMLEAAKRGADEDVSRALTALREVGSASAAASALELWTERPRVRKPG